jgi:hypothetical protein
MYYLKISKDYLTTKVDATTKHFLGYTNDYTFGELLLPFDYKGEQVEYLECVDGDIIAWLKLPHHFKKDGKDRALNKSYRQKEIQPEFLMYAYGKFGIENILTDLTNINLK